MYGVEPNCEPYQNGGLMSSKDRASYVQTVLRRNSRIRPAHILTIYFYFQLLSLVTEKASVNVSCYGTDLQLKDVS